MLLHVEASSCHQLTLKTSDGKHKLEMMSSIKLIRLAKNLHFYCKF